MTSRAPTCLSLRYKYGKKASCLKKPYGKINYYMLFISANGVGEGNIILALSILTGVGVQVHTISPWEIHGPIPMEPYTTCDFPVGPGLSAPSGSVLAPSLDSVWICLFFLFFTSQSTIFQLRRDGSSCVEEVLT